MSDSKHLTNEEIMEYVSLSKDTFNTMDTKKIFATILHLVECEKCRAIKDEMLLFTEKFDNLLYSHQGEGELELEL